MDVVAVVIALSILLTCMACEVPVAVSLIASGAVGLLLVEGWDNTTATLGGLPFSTVASYSLVLIPAFIFMGLACANSGLVDGIFSLAERIFRSWRAGIASAASLAAVVFGGVSGASVADAATIGRLSIGEMANRGYDKAYAAAVVAAAGTAAILIPPSITLVIFGILTGESIGKLLLAGIIPGVLTAVVEIGVINLTAKKYVHALTPVPVTVGGSPAADIGQGAKGSPRQHIAWTSYFGVFLVVSLIVTVLGGMYTGIFTSTEAGAVGAVAALVFAWLFTTVTRKRGANTTYRSVLLSSVSETSRLSASIFLLIVGSAIFTHFLVLARVPSTLAAWILSLSVPPIVVVILFLMLLLPLGMLLDGLSLLLIVTPIAYPVVTALGFDGIWLAILMVKMIEIGLITPPVGLNVFVVASLHKDLSVEKIFRRIWPFVASDIVVVAVLLAFPQIVLWLPSTSAVQ